MRKKSAAPALRFHLSGQSVCTLDGRDYYLGPHNSPEALARYAVLIQIYQQHGLSLPDKFDLSTLQPQVVAVLGQAAIPQNQANEPITVRHVTASFRLFCDSRYANRPQELHALKKVCTALEDHYTDLPAERFGPLALQAQRDRWVEAGKMSRKYVNRMTNAIVRIFKYATAQELVTNETWQRLKAVEPLRRGQTTARERPKVKPVPLEHVRKTAKFLSPVLRDMLRVMLGTGLRPSEVCAIKPGDIDRSGQEWIWRPDRHKTDWHGIEKAVPIVGDAREAIEDYMNRAPGSFCFSPIESYAWWRTQWRASRKTKVQPSQRNRKKADPKKQPRDHFDSNSFRQSVQRAAKLAGVPQWNPYRLRHTVATAVADALEPEFAQCLLGHTRIGMTLHYAKRSERKAIEAAKAAPRLIEEASNE